jgi:putative DNA primase/helicase
VPQVRGRTYRGRASEYRKSPPASRACTKGDNGVAAVRLWGKGIKGRGTLLERYLNESRRLELPDDIDGSVVRFHGACPWGVERRPCMLTAFRSIGDDRLVAVHRTLLSDKGRKLDRRMLGPVGGAAIKVDCDENVEYGLHICEGFETALAGRMLGFRPVWALGSAGAIGTFPVLSSIDALTILAETDDAGANSRNARKCARAWIAAGRDASIVVPAIPGDMNDLVMQ